MKRKQKLRPVLGVVLVPQQFLAQIGMQRLVGAVQMLQAWSWLPLADEDLEKAEWKARPGAY